jgi:hypothetical protein
MSLHGRSVSCAGDEQMTWVVFPWLYAATGVKGCGVAKFPNLPRVGWCYVGVIGALTIAGMATHEPELVLAPYVLAAPVGLVMPALSIILLALGFLLGYDVGQFAWPVTVLWVAAWLGAAWLNASLARAVGRGALQICRDRRIATPTH